MNEDLLKKLNLFLINNNLILNSNDFDFITNISWKTVLPIKCLICGNEFSISIKQLLIPHPERVGLVCPYCESKRLFINKLISVYGSNPYEFVSEFQGYNKPIKIKCKKCRL